MTLFLVVLAALFDRTNRVVLSSSADAVLSSGFMVPHIRQFLFETGFVTVHLEHFHSVFDDAVEGAVDGAGDGVDGDGVDDDAELPWLCFASPHILHFAVPSFTTVHIGHFHVVDDDADDGVVVDNEFGDGVDVGLIFTDFSSEVFSAIFSCLSFLVGSSLIGSGKRWSNLLFGGGCFL